MCLQMPKSKGTAQELRYFVRFTSTVKFPVCVDLCASHGGVTRFLRLRQTVKVFASLFMVLCSFALVPRDNVGKKCSQKASNSLEN